MSHSIADMDAHLIFSTKDRRPVLTDKVQGALHAYMAEILIGLKCTPILINSMPDHIHLLFDLGRTWGISRIVERVKTGTSKWIKTQGPAFSDFAWQTGYAVFAVSESNVPAVRKYVADQKEHHKTRTFQQEYIAFLKRHGMKYDERYIWD